MLMRSRLSGMPGCKLSYTAENLETIVYHPCIKVDKFEEGVVKFIPPDGQTELARLVSCLNFWVFFKKRHIFNIFFGICRYRVSKHIKLPFRVLPVIQKIDDNRLEVKVNLKAAFSKDLTVISSFIFDFALKLKHVTHRFPFQHKGFRCCPSHPVSSKHCQLHVKGVTWYCVLFPRIRMPHLEVSYLILCVCVRFSFFSFANARLFLQFSFFSFQNSQVPRWIWQQHQCRNQAVVRHSWKWLERVNNNTAPLAWVQLGACWLFENQPSQISNCVCVCMIDESGWLRGFRHSCSIPWDLREWRIREGKLDPLHHSVWILSNPSCSTKCQLNIFHKPAIIYHANWLYEKLGGKRWKKKEIEMNGPKENKTKKKIW